MYEATRKRRKGKRHQKNAHVGEISDLNITPMLDMMTILLVFLNCIKISLSSLLSPTFVSLANTKATRSIWDRRVFLGSVEERLPITDEKIYGFVLGIHHDQDQACEPVPSLRTAVVLQE